MAIDLTATYPAQTDTSDPTGYPQGKAKNVAVSGDGNGTPLEKAWLNDLFGFEQALLSEADIEPSGTPDKVGASDYLDALTRLLAINASRVAVENHVTRAPAGGYSSAVQALAWNGTLFCLVGSAGEIQTSPDGVTWTHRTAAGSYSGRFEGVVWSGSLFVAVGENAEIQTSPDGTTWTARTAAGGFSDDFFDVTHGDGLFVAVGEDATIQTSPDGTTWTVRTAGSGATANLNAVTYDATIGLFCAVGSSAEIQTSPDGTTWTKRTPGSGSTTGLLAVAAGNGRFVAVGSTSVQHSDDGVTWTASTSAAGGVLQGIAHSSEMDMYLAVGASGALQTSPNGITWKSHAIATLTANLIDCVAGLRTFVFGGASGTLRQTLRMFGA